jgi:hypothetical protein
MNPFCLFYLAASLADFGLEKRNIPLEFMAKCSNVHGRFHLEFKQQLAEK